MYSGFGINRQQQEKIQRMKDMQVRLLDERK